MENYRGNSEKLIKRLRKSERSELLRKSERKWWEKKVNVEKIRKKETISTSKYEKEIKQNKIK